MPLGGGEGHRIGDFRAEGAERSSRDRENYEGRVTNP